MIRMIRCRHCGQVWRGRDDDPFIVAMADGQPCPDCRDDST